MTEASDRASGGRYILAVIIILLIGVGLFLTRGVFDSDPAEAPVATAPEASPTDEAPSVPDAAEVETAEPAEAPEASDPPSDTAAAEAPEPEEAPETPPVAEAPEPSEETGPETVGDAPEAEADTAAEPAATDTAQADEPAAPGGPATDDTMTFDVVRIAPDGETLIAGKAAPGTAVTILLDGEPVGEAEADRDGNFVAIFSIGRSDLARVLALSTDGGTTEVVSAQEIIVSPMPEDPAPEPADTLADAPASEGPAEGTETAELDAEGPADGATPETETASADTGADAPAPEAAPAPPVPETPEAPTLLLAEGGDVRVIQSPSPTVMDEVAIDAITYDVEGEVTLTGRAGADGFVRVYLDNQPILTTEIAEDGNWRTALPDVDTGVYTLRVDAIDAAGNVTARAETPFLREAVEDVQTLAEDQEAGTPPNLVTVQPGNTLWGIASGRYGDGFLFVRVFEANKDQIRDPDLIYPGQIFTLPE